MLTDEGPDQTELRLNVLLPFIYLLKRRTPALMQKTLHLLLFPPPLILKRTDVEYSLQVQVLHINYHKGGEQVFNIERKKEGGRVRGRGKSQAMP